MRYWHAPLRPKGKQYFTTPGNLDYRSVPDNRSPRERYGFRGSADLADAIHLYVGEITKETYDRMAVDEFGLPINSDEDDFGFLP